MVDPLLAAAGPTTVFALAAGRSDQSTLAASVVVLWVLAPLSWSGLTDSLSRSAVYSV